MVDAINAREIHTEEMAVILRVAANLNDVITLVASVTDNTVIKSCETRGI